MRIARCGFPSLAVLTAGMVAAGGLGCRETAISKSQQARVEQRVGPVLVSIDYRRPVARGRRLFGGIVAYGKEWDPGADAATTIKFSDDVLLEGRPVPRGIYSVWAVPGAERWTFILSSAANVFHEPYPKGKDALRISVTPEKGPHMETLGFYFPMVDADSALLYLHWGETVIPLHLRARPRDARQVPAMIRP